MQRYTVDTRVAFIGRDRELQRLTALLESEVCVALTGPGGVGKSRLALEAAERWARRHDTGIYFVSLVGVAPEEIAGTVAAKLGVPQEPGRSALDALGDATFPQRLAIVLDNCEDAISEVRQVVNRLRPHPGLVVLTTSRKRFDAGETIFEVAPFDEADGNAFFVARARIAKVTVDLQSEDADAVHSIVKALDGLAVAIDLAAARLASLSVRELANELTAPRPYHFRSSASREPRHWTLSRLVDWSLAKLDREARQLFTFAGRFANVFRAGDLAALIGDTIRAPEVLLEKLAEHSLVVRVDEGRYAMLAPIRTVAKRRLEHARELRAIDERFVQHMNALGLDLTERMETAQSAVALSIVAERYDDFISALTWALQKPAERFGKAVNVFSALATIWCEGRRCDEGLRWCDRCTPAAGALDHARRGRIYYTVLRIALAACEYERILRIGPELISTFTIANDRLRLARTYNMLGVASLSTNRAAEAQTYVNTALALYEAIGHELGIASALCNQGNIALDGFGDPVTARKHYLRGLDVMQHSGAESLIALAHANLAEAAHQTGDPDEIEHRAHLALEGFTRLGNVARSAWAHCLLAHAKLIRNDGAGAAQELLVALNLLERQPNPDYLARCVATAATLLSIAEKHQQAATLALAAQRLRHERRVPAMGRALDDLRSDLARIQRNLNDDQIRRAAEEANTLDLTGLPGIARRALAHFPSNH